MKKNKSKKQETVPFTVQFPEALARIIKTESKKAGISANKLVVSTVARHFNSSPGESDRNNLTVQAERRLAAKRMDRRRKTLGTIKLDWAEILTESRNEREEELG